MILLISSLLKAQEFVHALQEAAGEPVQSCSVFSDAIVQLQSQEFSAVILDQLLLDADPEEGEIARKHFGPAIPVYVNFATSGSARVIGELRAALQRRQQEMVAARRHAEQALRHQLSDSVTALLLSCELALQVPGLPDSAESKLQVVDALAREMSVKLGAMA